MIGVKTDAEFLEHNIIQEEETCNFADVVTRQFRDIPYVAYVLRTDT